MQISHQAVRAKQDQPFLERFIQSQEPFILRAASKYAGRAVTRSDDEFSVAMLAFYEAVRGYDAESGSFGSFAYLVVGRRLTDYYRAARRFDPEVSLAPQTFDGDVDTACADAAVQLAVAEKLAEPGPASAADEIEAADALFGEYGFSFYDLADCSPRADKTRKGCARAIAALLRTAVLFAELQNTHSLPIKALAAASGVPKKLIERHRRYIIAAALLLDGDYPMLSEYLQTIRREADLCGR